MHILLTNDDGIEAKGLNALYLALQDLGDITIVAPVSEMSGVSHGFSLRGPIKVREVNRNGSLYGYSVQGTPVDAVKVAIRALLPAKPDLVVSGINQGANTGVDLLYSGTVAAAMEAATLDIPAVAVSLASVDYRDFDTAGHFARIVCKSVIEKGIPHGNVINVNVPPLPLDEIRGLKLTKQARSFYKEGLEGRNNGDGVDYYWTSWAKTVTDEAEDNDVQAVQDGFVSVTPIHARLTDEELLLRISDWGIATGA